MKDQPNTSGTDPAQNMIVGTPKRNPHSLLTGAPGRNRGKTVELSGAEGGGFIEGGFRPTPRQIVLPPIDDVMPGSIYQDETGAEWKTIEGGFAFRRRWLLTETVTASEHAAARRKRLIWLILSLLAVGLSATSLFGVIPYPPATVRIPIWLLTVAGIFGFTSAWARAADRVASQIVAPAPPETSENL